MNFEEELKAILSALPGAQAAVLMGFDGIPVAEVRDGSFEASISDLTVEYSRLLKEAIKICQGSDLGGVCEFSLDTELYRFVFRIVNPDYFLGLLMKTDANLGKGRFLLRKSTPAFHAEL